MFLDNKLAVFDMDGTIVDTIGFWRNSPKRYLNSVGKEVFKEDEDYFKYYVLRDSVIKMVEKYNIEYTPDELFRLLEDEVKVGYKTIKGFKAGADAFLLKLKEKGIPTILYTANEREYVDIINENLSLDRYFDHIFTATELGAGKDSREGFERIAKMYGKAINDIVLFEDSYYAIHSAKEFGMQSVAISDTHSENRLQEIKNECTYFINTYKDLPIS